MHPTSSLPRSARGARPYLAALAATPPVLALTSAHALTEPEALVPNAFEARAGASGVAGSGSGGAAGSGAEGLGGGGRGGAAGSSARDGARPLEGSQQAQAQQALPATCVAQSPATCVAQSPATCVAQAQLPTTLRRDVQLENGSEQAPGDQAGSLATQALTADLMVITNGSCGDEADQVGVARNPRDRAP